MLSRIERYFARELALAFGAVLIVLTAIMVSNVLARLLVRVAEGRMAADALFVIMGLQLVKAMTVLVPFATFLALMLTLGRFYRDSEMAALMACGVGPGRLYRGLLLFAIPLLLALAWVALYGAPRAAALSEDMARRAEQLAQTSFVIPGQFRELADGRIVAYTESMNADSGELRGIFIRVLGNELPDMIMAKSGRQYRDPETGARYLLLEQGVRYQGEPGSLEFRITKFESFAVLIEDPGDRGEGRRRSQLPTGDLLDSEDNKHLAELQWRIAVPFSLIVLVALAPPLAHANPREGRYGRVAMAILIFLLYMNLMSIGKAWIEKGAVPPSFGLWWVHLVFVGFALVLASRIRWIPFGAAAGGNSTPAP